MLEDPSFIKKLTPPQRALLEEIILLDIKKYYFAHFTSIKACESILKGQQLWLRDTDCMEDTSEINYGFNYLRVNILEKFEKEIFAFFDRARAHERDREVYNKILNVGNGTQKPKTYILCLNICENNEDYLYNNCEYMWKNYCNGGDGVAIIFNQHIMNIAFYSHFSLAKVNYSKNDFISNKFKRVLEKANICIASDNSDENNRLVLSYFFTFLANLGMSIKKEAYKKERETRIICAPETLSGKKVFNQATESIRGKDEEICYADLKQKIDFSELQKLINNANEAADRVPINPNKGEETILNQSLESIVFGRKTTDEDRERLLSAMREANIYNPQSKIKKIPILKTQSPFAL